VTKSEAYESEIPDHRTFSKQREAWRFNLASDTQLRDRAVELTVLANVHNYGYQWEWCGIPIIRHPDDIVLQQEIMWDLKPTRVIETGVARGGSLALSSSLMAMYTKFGKVLGIDLQILDHAHDALSPWIKSSQIEILESDSTSELALEKIKRFLQDNNSPVLTVLDSNHSHEHVLKELENFSEVLPIGSIIMVADTIVEEMPDDYYINRPWEKGSNPLTAVNAFLHSNNRYIRDKRWSRRSLMGECRDGILLKIS
jgi:cephalosporin hydroxylase